mmetsp:Transcript_24642/g.79658  ORF Transcript_24642/g.79658 Transcript_24642/m.79658 type:complete len:223 (-) Transcript_24642:124-792(-)
MMMMGFAPPGGGGVGVGEVPGVRGLEPGLVHFGADGVLFLVARSRPPAEGRRGEADGVEGYFFRGAAEGEELRVLEGAAVGFDDADGAVDVGRNSNVGLPMLGEGFRIGLDADDGADVVDWLAAGGHRAESRVQLVLPDEPPLQEGRRHRARPLVVVAPRQVPPRVEPLDARPELVDAHQPALHEAQEQRVRLHLPARDRRRLRLQHEGRRQVVAADIEGPR